MTTSIASQFATGALVLCVLTATAFICAFASYVWFVTGYKDRKEAIQFRAQSYQLLRDAEQLRVDAEAYVARANDILAGVPKAKVLKFVPRVIASDFGGAA